MEIKEGDLVELRSGGPTMTVLVVDEFGNLSVAWYDNSSAEVKTGEFAGAGFRVVVPLSAQKS